ncbi:uncharacterized protein LOC108949666 [Ciona intestinalis]
MSGTDSVLKYGDWLWQDGTEVLLPRKSTYSQSNILEGWNNGQPNLYSEIYNCGVILYHSSTEAALEGYVCYAQLYRLCQGPFQATKSATFSLTKKQVFERCGQTEAKVKVSFRNRSNREGIMTSKLVTIPKSDDAICEGFCDLRVTHFSMETNRTSWMNLKYSLSAQFIFTNDVYFNELGYNAHIVMLASDYKPFLSSALIEQIQSNIGISKTTLITPGVYQLPVLLSLQQDYELRKDRYTQEKSFASNENVNLNGNLNLKDYIDNRQSMCGSFVYVTVVILPNVQVLGNELDTYHNSDNTASYKLYFPCPQSNILKYNISGSKETQVIYPELESKVSLIVNVENQYSDVSAFPKFSHFRSKTAIIISDAQFTLNQTSLTCHHISKVNQLECSYNLLPNSDIHLHSNHVEHSNSSKQFHVLASFNMTRSNCQTVKQICLVPVDIVLNSEDIILNQSLCISVISDTSFYPVPTQTHHNCGNFTNSGTFCLNMSTLPKEHGILKFCRQSIILVNDSFSWQPLSYNLRNSSSELLLNISFQNLGQTFSFSDDSISFQLFASPTKHNGSINGIAITNKTVLPVQELTNIHPWFKYRDLLTVGHLKINVSSSECPSCLTSRYFCVALYVGSQFSSMVCSEPLHGVGFTCTCEAKMTVESLLFQNNVLSISSLSVSQVEYQAMIHFHSPKETSLSALNITNSTFTLQTSSSLTIKNIITNVVMQRSDKMESYSCYNGVQCMLYGGYFYMSGLLYLKPNSSDNCKLQGTHKLSASISSSLGRGDSQAESSVLITGITDLNLVYGNISYRIHSNGVLELSAVAHVQYIGDTILKSLPKESFIQLQLDLYKGAEDMTNSASTAVLSLSPMCNGYKCKTAIPKLYPGQVVTVFQTFYVFSGKIENLGCLSSHHWVLVAKTSNAYDLPLEQCMSNNVVKLPLLTEKLNCSNVATTLQDRLVKAHVIPLHIGLTLPNLPRSLFPAFQNDFLVDVNTMIEKNKISPELLDLYSITGPTSTNTLNITAHFKLTQTSCEDKSCKDIFIGSTSLFHNVNKLLFEQNSVNSIQRFQTMVELNDIRMCGWVYLSWSFTVSSTNRRVIQFQVKDASLPDESYLTYLLCSDPYISRAGFTLRHVTPIPLMSYKHFERVKFEAKFIISTASCKPDNLTIHSPHTTLLTNASSAFPKLLLTSLQTFEYPPSSFLAINHPGIHHLVVAQAELEALPQSDGRYLDVPLFIRCGSEFSKVGIIPGEAYKTTKPSALTFKVTRFSLLQCTSLTHNLLDLNASTLFSNERDAKLVNFLEPYYLEVEYSGPHLPIQPYSFTNAIIVYFIMSSHDLNGNNEILLHQLQPNNAQRAILQGQISNGESLKLSDLATGISVPGDMCGNLSIGILLTHPTSVIANTQVLYDGRSLTSFKILDFHVNCPHDILKLVEIELEIVSNTTLDKPFIGHTESMLTPLQQVHLEGWLKIINQNDQNQNIRLNNITWQAAISEDQVFDINDEFINFYDTTLSTVDGTNSAYYQSSFVMPDPITLLKFDSFCEKGLYLLIKVSENQEELIVSNNVVAQPFTVDCSNISSSLKILNPQILTDKAAMTTCDAENCVHYLPTSFAEISSKLNFEAQLQLDIPKYVAEQSLPDLLKTNMKFLLSKTVNSFHVLDGVYGVAVNLTFGAVTTSNLETGYKRMSSSVSGSINFQFIETNNSSALCGMMYISLVAVLPGIGFNVIPSPSAVVEPALKIQCMPNLFNLISVKVIPQQLDLWFGYGSPVNIKLTVECGAPDEICSQLVAGDLDYFNIHLWASESTLHEGNKVEIHPHIISSSRMVGVHVWPAADFTSNVTYPEKKFQASFNKEPYINQYIIKGNMAIVNVNQINCMKYRYFGLQLVAGENPTVKQILSHGNVTTDDKIHWIPFTWSCKHDSGAEDAGFDLTALSSVVNQQSWNMADINSMEYSNLVGISSTVFHGVHSLNGITGALDNERKFHYSFFLSLDNTLSDNDRKLEMIERTDYVEVLTEPLHRQMPYNARYHIHGDLKISAQDIAYLCTLTEANQMTNIYLILQLTTKLHGEIDELNNIFATQIQINSCSSTLIYNHINHALLVGGLGLKLGQNAELYFEVADGRTDIKMGEHNMPDLFLSVALYSVQNDLVGSKNKDDQEKDVLITSMFSINGQMDVVRSLNTSASSWVERKTRCIESSHSYGLSGPCKSKVAFTLPLDGSLCHHIWKLKIVIHSVYSESMFVSTSRLIDGVSIVCPGEYIALNGHQLYNLPQALVPGKSHQVAFNINIGESMDSKSINMTAIISNNCQYDVETKFGSCGSSHDMKTGFSKATCSNQVLSKFRF